MPNTVTFHDDHTMSGIKRQPKLYLSEIAAAIRATKDRIYTTEPEARAANEARGVRRTAAHIADLLSDSDKQAFLTACGYGA